MSYVVTLYDSAGNSDFPQGFPYQLEGQLGKGSFGSVFKAVQIQPKPDQNTDPTVVVPIWLRPEFVIKIFKDQEFYQKFKDVNRDGLQVLDPSRFAYPITDFSPDASLWSDSLASKTLVQVVVASYFSGVELFKYIEQKEDGIDPNEQREFADQLCALVKEMHAAGVIHHDLKPENLIIDEHGWIGVIDLDYSMPLGSVEQRCPGTKTYASPELLCNACLQTVMRDFAKEQKKTMNDLDKQHMKDKIATINNFITRVDEKVDIWSVIAILFIFFTGRHLIYEEQVQDFFEFEYYAFRQLCLTSDPVTTSLYRKYQQLFFAEFKRNIFSGIKAGIERAAYKDEFMAGKLSEFFEDIVALYLSPKGISIPEIQAKMDEYSRSIEKGFSMKDSPFSFLNPWS